MPYCPICKNEYREGFTTCSECKCDLVDSLDDIQKEEELPEEEFFMPEGDELDEEAIKEAIKEAKEARASYKSNVYIDNESKANENRSSGWTFLIVGIAGVLAMTLIACGVIPLSLNPNAKFLIYGVMYAMFALFIVIGVISMRNSTRFEHEAKSEKSLNNEIFDFCKTDLVPKMLEDEADISKEELYFKRTEIMKSKINDKFMNLDEAFLDNFIDKSYSELFGEDE